MKIFTFLIAILAIAVTAQGQGTWIHGMIPQMP